MKKSLKPLKNMTAAGVIAAASLMPLQAVFAEDTATPATTVYTNRDCCNQLRLACTQLPPPPAATEPAAEKEEAYNPYGLEAMWKEGDMVSKITLFILIIMSIGTWYIIDQSNVYSKARSVNRPRKLNTNSWNPLLWRQCHPKSG